MSNPSTAPQTGAEDGETPTQKQARLRRERREAKIKAGGTSRLEKITNVSGRQNLPGTCGSSRVLPLPQFNNYEERNPRKVVTRNPGFARRVIIDI